MIRTLWTSIIFVVLALAVSGCFKSDVPFISADEADFPFKRLTYEIVGEEDRVTLVRVGDAYAAPEEQGESTLLMKALGDDYFLLQAQIADSERPFFLYAVARLEADRKSAEIIKPFAELPDRELARQNKHGFQVCPEDEQMICLSDLQSFIDYAVSSTTEEKKRIRILSMD